MPTGVTHAVDSCQNLATIGSATGGAGAGKAELGSRFGTVFVTRISWSEDDDGPKESVTFAHASLAVQYKQFLPTGEPAKAGAVGYGWDQSKNTVWDPQKIVT